MYFSDGWHRAIRFTFLYLYLKTKEVRLMTYANTAMRPTTQEGSNEPTTKPPKKKKASVDFSRSSRERPQEGKMDKVRAELRALHPRDVKDIPEWILEHRDCYEIPVEGAKVRYREGKNGRRKEGLLYPIWAEPEMDNFAYHHCKNNLGVFNIKKNSDGVDVMSIHTSDGRSFIFTDTEKIKSEVVDALIEANYEKKDKLFVELVNGEELI